MFLLNLRRAEEVSNVIIIDNLRFLLINGGQRLTTVVLVDKSRSSDFASIVNRVSYLQFLKAFYDLSVLLFLLSFHIAPASTNVNITAA